MLTFWTKGQLFDIAGGNALTAGSDIFMRGLISTSLSFSLVMLCLAYNASIKKKKKKLTWSKNEDASPSCRICLNQCFFRMPNWHLFKSYTFEQDYIYEDNVCTYFTL